jgi:hypothetical protein
VPTRAGLGVVADLRAGPEVRLGAPAGLREKWRAATRVLAEPSTAGAAYVDVRLPARPVTGGLPGGAGGPPDMPGNTQVEPETLP